MALEEFLEELRCVDNETALRDFAIRKILHGTPYLFYEREEELYNFKERICQKFTIHHTEILLVGSAKLGFSPIKKTHFSLDSDVDIAIVSEELWEKVFQMGMELEYARKNAQITFHNEQLKKYHRFLKFMAIGWVRPDLIPQHLQMSSFKNDWFEFFNSISYGRSEAGDYKVNAGIFRNHMYLEKYSTNSVKYMQQNITLPENA
ncbi:hypothetical protein [Salinicola halophyticus]|uniref:hypothetical protein n=1 Tax=Salinicola halophyticus TaxID=1808881 RepID=UPI000DA2132A|nr:hypothetical protein [Salinicola halophyticus]